MQNEDSTMAKPVSTQKRRKKSSKLNPREPLKERGRRTEKKKKKKKEEEEAAVASWHHPCFAVVFFLFSLFFFGSDSMESREP